MAYRSPITSSADTVRVTSGIVLFAPFILAGLVLAIPLAIAARFLPKRQVTAEQVADALRALLDGTGGEWDWDDFASTSFDDSRLEVIRVQADRVRLPLDGEGEAKLKALLDRAEALAAERA